MNNKRLVYLFPGSYIAGRAESTDWILLSPAAIERYVQLGYMIIEEGEIK